MTAAAILAGGRATRFEGRDKAALPLGTRRVIDRQLAVLRRVADHVLVVANERRRYGELSVPIVADAIAGAGALGGLYTALVTSPAPRTLVVACDLPFLTVAFLEHVLAAGRDVDIAVPRTAEGYEPLCACYAPTCVAPIRRRIEAGLLKVADVLATPELRVCEIGPEEIAPYDPDGRLLLNLNTPQDYTRALELLGHQPNDD